MSVATLGNVTSERLVGRDSALEILDAMKAALSAGVGGAVLVEGEQGIGKTELLRTSLTGGSAHRLLWGAADELGQSVPLTLMRQCLADADVEPPARALQPGTAPGVFTGDPVLAAVEEILASVDRLCASSPVVLVAEDLQWADEASVLAWYRLSRAVSQLPLLVVGSFRSGSDRNDMARLRRSLTAHHGTVIELGPLAPSEMGVLAQRLAGGRPGSRLTGLLGWTGGNPLYARELVDGLVRDGRIQVDGGIAELVGGPGLAGVPESVSAAVAERLAHLDVDMIEVLRWAAVLGTEFSVTDLAAVTARPTRELIDVIGGAHAAGVVADGEHGLAFRHGLIRQVLYEQMAAPLRAGLHRHAAEALATVGAAPERIAAQLVAAVAPGAGPEGTPVAGPEGNAGAGHEAAQPWVLDWLTRYSPVLAYRAPRVTADLLGSVLRELAADDPRRRSLEASLLTPLFLIGRDAEVEQVGRRLLTAAGDPDLSWLVAYSMIRAGRAVEAAELLRAEQGDEGAVPTQRARLSALNGNILALLGRIDRAAEEARAALATGADDPLAQGFAHYVLSSLSYLRRDSRSRLRHLDEGIAAVGNDTQLTDLSLLMQANRANVLNDLDRKDDALAAGRAAVMLGDRIGGPRVLWARTMLAIAYYSAGQWSDALAEIEPALDSEISGYIGPYAHSLAALIAARRDDGDEAARHLSAVPDTAGWAKLAGPQALHGPMMARAVAAEQAGRPGDAVAVLAQCLLPDLGKMMPMRHVLLPDLTRLALETGDAGLARAAADAAAVEAQLEPLRWKQSIAEHCRGLVERDVRAVLRAADQAKAASRLVEYADALENAAVLLAAGDGEAAARKMAAEAVRQHARLGAQWHVRRATERLRAQGFRQVPRTRRGRPDSGWAALTPTEVRVAQLVGQGLSNPDIAARLFLSRNTVQTHVSHILAKLGAPSRVEIIRLAAAHSPSAAR
jgi:DNA-binding CsgD family transcriptional regulator/tetratricopeptide (TPR) repeat protein